MLIPRSAEDICNQALGRAGVSERVASLAGDNTRTSEACQTAYDDHRRNLIMELRPSWTVKRKVLTPLSGNPWAAGTTYGADALVAYGENVYRSLKAMNTGNEPDLAASAAWWVQVTRDGWAYVCSLPDDCLDPLQAWEAPSVSVNGVPSPFIGSRDPDDAFNLRNPRSTGRIPFKLENANDGTDNLVLLTDLDAPVLKYVGDITNPAAMPAPFKFALAWYIGSDLALDLKGDQTRAEFCLKMGNFQAGKAFIIDERDQQEDEQPVSEFEAARHGRQ